MRYKVGDRFMSRECGWVTEIVCIYRQRLTAIPYCIIECKEAGEILDVPIKNLILDNEKLFIKLR